MGYNRLIITKHIQDRIAERFPEVYETIRDNARCELKHLINNGYVSKSFLNNSKFMQYLYDTYGYEHTYDFVVSGDIVFVIKKNKGQNIAVTCLDSKTTTFISKATKFKKRKKKVKRPVGVHDLSEVAEIDVDVDKLLLDLRK
jgi:hypothetical protein